MGALALSSLYIMEERGQCLAFSSAASVGAAWMWGDKKVPHLAAQSSFGFSFIIF